MGLFLIGKKGREFMDTQILVYNILKDIIALAGTILIGFITAYVNQHFTATQVSNAKQVATIAVTFAEQIANSMGFKGQDKYNSALSKAKDLATKYGVKMTDDQWQGLIEAAVKEMNHIWNSSNGATTIHSNADGDGSTVNTIISKGSVDNSVSADK
jgi:hypothetical protein